MKGAEGDRRGYAERAFTGVRNAGLMVALFGAAVMLLSAPIGATVVEFGAVGAGTGELGRRAAASGKPK